MKFVELDRLTQQDRLGLEGEETDPYGTDSLGLSWRDKEIYFGARDSNGCLVAVAGLVVAKVEKRDDGTFPVVGLGDIIVRHGHRGRGLARAVIERAMRCAECMGPEFAVLFCDEGMVALYRRFGFNVVSAGLMVAQPTGAIQMPLVTMWRPLRQTASWPTGAFCLHGLPF